MQYVVHDPASVWFENVNDLLGCPQLSEFFEKFVLIIDLCLSANVENL